MLKAIAGFEVALDDCAVATEKDTDLKRFRDIADRGSEQCVRWASLALMEKKDSREDSDTGKAIRAALQSLWDDNKDNTIVTEVLDCDRTMHILNMSAGDALAASAADGASAAAGSGSAAEASTAAPGEAPEEAGALSAPDGSLAETRDATADGPAHRRSSSAGGGRCHEDALQAAPKKKPRTAEAAKSKPGRQRVSRQL